MIAQGRATRSELVVDSMSPEVTSVSPTSTASKPTAASDRASSGPRIPDSATRTTDAGIRGPDDARSLAEVGFDAVLVGETLVTSGDIESTTNSLRVARP